MLSTHSWRDSRLSWLSVRVFVLFCLCKSVFSLIDNNLLTVSFRVSSFCVLHVCIVHVYVCVHARVHVYTCPPVCMGTLSFMYSYRGQRSLDFVALFTLFLRQGVLSLEIIILARPPCPCPWDPPASFSPMLGLQMPADTFGFDFVLLKPMGYHSDSSLGGFWLLHNFLLSPASHKLQVFFSHGYIKNSVNIKVLYSLFL